MSDRIIEHLEEFKDVLYAISGDDKLCRAFSSAVEEGEPITMCKLSDRLHEEGKIETLDDLVKDGILTMQQTAEKMGMTVANFQVVVKKLSEN